MPEQCNAKIQVGNDTVTCTGRSCGDGGIGRHGHYQRGRMEVYWTDDTPGAVPHTEPTRLSVQERVAQIICAVARKCRWDDGGDSYGTTVEASYEWDEGLAIAELLHANGLLNGAAADLVDVGELLRDRDEAVADWKQAVLAQQEACRERDRAVYEAKRYAARADRYRETLEVLSRSDDGPWMRRHAQRALERVSRDNSA